MAYIDGYDYDYLGSSSGVISSRTRGGKRMNRPQGLVLQNPFVGLRPYRSDDGIHSFGRGEQTKRLLGLLYAHHFVAVVGSSGSGKSSLVRAGLIPQLEDGFLVQERDHWHIAIMKPGIAPLSNLIQTLKGIKDKGQSAEEKNYNSPTDSQIQKKYTVWTL